MDMKVQNSNSNRLDATELSRAQEIARHDSVKSRFSSGEVSGGEDSIGISNLAYEIDKVTAVHETARSERIERPEPEEARDRVNGLLHAMGPRTHLVVKTGARSILLPMVRIEWLQAEGDYQVTMEDFQIWKSALSVRSNVQFKSYEGLFHLFMPFVGGEKSTPAAYNVPGHVVEDVIEDIAEWVKHVF